MSRRQSVNRRSSRHGRSSNFSGIVNPDSNIIDDDNPLWWKNLDGDSIMARRSMRLSIANRASTSLDPESRIESFEFSKEWWKNIDDTEHVTSKDHNSVSKTKNESSVQDKEVTDNCEPSDVSNKDESIYKKKHALFASKKRKSHGTSNFLNVLNETSITTTSEPPVTRSRKEVATDNSYLSYNDDTLNKYKKILRNHKRFSEHSVVNETHKTMEDNSLNRSNKRNTDSSRESDHTDGHVIKSKRVLRSTKHKETTGNVFDDLLLEDKNITSKRSIENANESEDSVERSLKKSRLNIFKKKRLSLAASMLQKAIEDDTMEESNRQNDTAENDPASNANNLSMSLTQMTQTLYSKMNNSEKKSFNSKTNEPQTPSKLKNQPNISELLNHSKVLSPSVILTHSPTLDNLVLNVGSRSLTHRASQNRIIQEQNSEHKVISKKVFNEETGDQSQDNSKCKNVDKVVHKINRKKTTTPSRETRSSTTPHKKMHTNYTEKKDFSTGSDADNSSSESENPSIVKRNTLTADKRTHSTASLNRINESLQSYINQSGNVERFRMTRSRSKSNLQDSPKSVKNSHESSLNFRNEYPIKTKETMENVENNRSTHNFPVLVSSKKSISEKQNSTILESLENPTPENQDIHHSFDNNQYSSQDPEESVQKSQNKSNRKAESPINLSQISSPKKSITHNEDDTKNDETKSDKNDLPKSKPNFLHKLRKSLAADTFDNILASKSIKDSKVNMTSDHTRTDIPRDNNSPVSIITERSDVDFCPDTPSTSNLKMGPISQSTPYSKKVVPSTPSTLNHINNNNVVNGMFQIKSFTVDQQDLSNTSQTNKIDNKISNILQHEHEINKNTQNNETIIDKTITDCPSVSNTISNVVKRPTIISSITSHLKVSRITKKQTILNKDTNQASTQILQNKDKMAEIKKVLENIKRRELEKIDRYLIKTPAEQINKPTIPNKRPFQLKNKESVKKPKQVDKAYIVNGKVYKRAKLPRPKSWATNRLYEYLWKRLESKYKLNTRVRSEKFILQLADVVSLTIRRKKYENYRNEVDALMNDMARLQIIKTRNDFYDFCYDFLPYEFRVKATPILLPGNVMSIPYDPNLLHTPILND